MSLVNYGHDGPDQFGVVGWTSSCKPKGHLFSSQSGHMPGLRVQSMVGALMEVNQSMFLSHINI